MKTLGNILWFIFGGLEWAIACCFLGVFYCITVIGIPVGLQMFKMAGFVIWPFGKRVEATSVNGFKTFLNIVWMIFGGIELMICFMITGAIYCITIIGIPFGKQYFKMGKFILMPLGHTFVKGDAAPATAGENTTNTAE